MSVAEKDIGKNEQAVFTARNPETALKLVQEIHRDHRGSGLILLGKGQLPTHLDKMSSQHSGFVFDWDGVATVTNDDPLDISRKPSFQLIDDQMSADPRIFSRNMRADYIQLFRRGMSTDDGKKWTTDSIELHVREGFTVKNTKIAAELTVIREGFPELLSRVQERSPVVIVSYGLADVITPALQNLPDLKVMPDVYATKYQLDERERLIGYHPKTLVDPRSKAAAIERFCDDHGLKPSNLVIMGDSASDILMKTDPSAYYVHVAHSGYGPNGNLSIEKMENIFSKTNAILVGESLMPVVKHLFN